MKKAILRGFWGFSLLGLLVLSGCAGKIELNPTDQELVKIQDEASQKIQDLSQRLLGENIDYTEISKVADDVTRWLNTQIQRLAKMRSDIESSAIFEQTKEVLESGQRLASKVEELTSQVSDLSAKVQTLAADAKTAAEAKISDMKKSIEGFQTRLSEMKQKFDELKSKLFEANKQ